MAAAQDAPDTQSSDLWVFEPAEPGVGIFHEQIYHECGRGEGGVSDDAVIDFTQTSVADGLVTMTTRWRCPGCQETRETTEQWPADDRPLP